MKKIISSLLLFAMMFTAALPCFAESERLLRSVPQEATARMGDVSLGNSDEVLEERLDLTENLEVIDNDSISIRSKNAGISEDARRFLISLGAFVFVIVGWVAFCALRVCGGW